MWSRNRNVLAGCAFIVAVLLVAQTPPAEAQAGAGAQAPQGEEPPTSQTSPTSEEGLEEPAEVAPVPEGIEITEGSGYRYQARGRRDPFVSLALGVAVLDEGVRPPGLAGMLIQEVSLRGIVRTTDGYIAMIQGTDNKSYFAQSGERLYDGNIQSIDDEKVVFRQEINDPLRIERFQEVEKSLHPVEEVQR